MAGEQLALSIPIDAIPASFRPERVIANDATRVVVGRHDFLCCDVAVEFPGALDEIPEEQFARWARISSLLDHPNCARVEEFGTLQGTPYAIYRGSFVHLTDLEPPLSPRDLARIASGLMRALDHAHDRGVFHGWLGVDAMLVPEDDLSRVQVKNFAIDSWLGDEAEAVRVDLVAAGRIVWWLATGDRGANPLDREVRVAGATRGLVTRLLGIGPQPRFVSAREALLPIERAFIGAGGTLSGEPGWADPSEHPPPELPPSPPAEESEEAAEPEDDSVPVERRAAVLRGVSIATLVAALVVVAVWLGPLLLADSDPKVPANEIFEQLDRANDPARARALSWAERHALVATLRNDGRVADLLDEQLHTALELEQASGADDPCAVFGSALERIASAPALYYRDALQRAQTPPRCAHLQERLILLRAAIRP